MTEHDEQVSLFNWAAASLGRYPELALMYAIGNQRIGKIPRIKMAAEGVKAGVPDVHLPVVRYYTPGLWIENKVGDNYPSKEQQWWLQEVTRQGFLCAVSWDWTMAKDFIMDYLDGKTKSKYEGKIVYLKHYADGSSLKLVELNQNNINPI